jgi:predicted porin
MNKKIIVAAVAAALAVPMAASADATVYGKVRVASQYANHSEGTADTWGMEDQVSRLGIKGSEDLGDGLKAIYQMEMGVNVGDGFGKPGGSAFWSQRNSFVGLAGNWGTLLAGRHDTPYKISTGSLDFFGDTAADMDNGYSGLANPNPTNPNGVDLFSSVRADGAIAYISPSFSGLTLAGAVVQTNTALTKDFQNAYSLAGLYSNGPWFASLAYENLDKKATVGTKDDAKWRVGLGVLGMSNFSASAIYEDHTNVLGLNNADYKSWEIQAAYDFGSNRAKAMYGEYDGKDLLNGFDHNVWAIGLQHNFSKRTDVQVLYRARDNKGNNVTNDDVFALQLDHAF